MQGVKTVLTDKQPFEELRRRDFHGTLSKGQYTI